MNMPMLVNLKLVSDTEPQQKSPLLITHSSIFNSYDQRKENSNPSLLYRLSGYQRIFWIKKLRKEGK